MHFDRQRLTFLRAQRGLNMTELATLSGVDLSSIWRIEGGKRIPGDATLAKLAKALRCEPEAFMALDQPSAEAV